ncbi:MAG: hypothetical protein ACR2G7_11670 [Acidimicrobiales bacterium]
MASGLFEQMDAERATGKMFTLRQWLADHPPADTAFTQFIAGVARRVQGGEPFLPCVRDLLDEVGLMATPAQRHRTITHAPEPTGDVRYDAYLAALASTWRPSTTSSDLHGPASASASSTGSGSWAR